MNVCNKLPEKSLLPDHVTSITRALDSASLYGKLSVGPGEKRGKLFIIKIFCARPAREDQKRQNMILVLSKKKKIIQR